jgi:hypothetical protein
MAARSKRATRVRAKSAASSRTRAAKRGGRSGRDVSVKAKAPKKAAKKWSAGVMAHSDAMDLESGVFKSRSARQVALSLKRSAESSHRRKSTPFRSAMSMLNFEINRGGKNLSVERRKVLNAAKVELRKVFHREPARP